MKQRTNKLKIASWNLRSLIDGGKNEKPRQLAKTARILGIDILIMLETWHDEAHGVRADNHYNYWCGPCDNGHHGVGFLVYKDISVIDFQKYEIGGSFARAAQLTIQTKKGKRSLYALYAPHVGLGDDVVRRFWEEAQELPQINKSIVGVDANAHVSPEQWDFPAIQTNQIKPIPPTNACGYHLLAFANRLSLRPANLMRQAPTWESRFTFNADGHNKTAPPSVIDFIFIPTNRSSEFSNGAHPIDTPKSDIRSDHRMLTIEWTVITHLATATPRCRPTTGPAPRDCDDDINTADEMYRELFKAVQGIHGNETQQMNEVEHHIKYANWVPPMDTVHKLRSLVLRLQREKSPIEDIRDAQKRLRETYDERRKKSKQETWGKMRTAFDRNDTKDAFKLLSRATNKQSRKRFTKRDHIDQQAHFRKILSNPPLVQAITIDDMPYYENAEQIRRDQEIALENFDPNSSHAAFVDGSFTNTLASEGKPHASKCGWAAFDSLTQVVFFGAAPPNSEHSANHGETLALLGAQEFCVPTIVVTDSSHVETMAANLAAEASDDMRHCANSETWREIWHNQGQRPIQIVKVKGHSGIRSHEIAHVFAALGAELAPGECRKCKLQESDISQLATNDTIWNEKHEWERKNNARKLESESTQTLTLRGIPCVPRRAADHTPTEREIRLALWELNADSAAGPDGIKPRDLKDDRILPLLTALIKEIWKTGLIPKHWLQSYLIGIPKPHDTCTRGIALTSTCLKVLTAVIRNRTANFSLLCSQWGFRTHRGTAQATTLLREMLNRRAASGLHTTTIAIDLTKAFDSVRRDGLKKLLKEYGYGEIAASLVEQIYDGDTMILFLNNENLSDVICPEKGVKQGCLLSSGIFNIFVDRALRVMAKEFPNVTGNDPEYGALVLAYADDMAIIAKDDEEALAFMSRFIQVLGSYGLLVNAKKTKVLRTLPRTHSTTQSQSTYWRRIETQGKFPGDHSRPCALVDFANRPATMTTARAILYVPCGTESVLTCSHCIYPGGYAAMTNMKSTPQKRMAEHVRRHLKPECRLEVKTTLFGHHSGFGISTETQEHRPTMTDGQARTATPFFMPPLQCPNFHGLEPTTLSFEAVEQIIYLGSAIHHDGNTDPELKARISSGHIAYGKLRGQLGSERNDLKIWLYEVYVSSRLFFGTETWAQTKAQCSTLNSIRMNHIRTITNCWDHGKLEHLTCPEHSSPWIFTPRPNPQPTETYGVEKCATCKTAGTTRFWYARRFLINLNALRNRKILTHTFMIHRLLRRANATRKDSQNIMCLIYLFAGMSQPNWLPHWLPKPYNRALLERYNLPSTANLIAKRRANLLGNLVRHRALPNMACNAGRAGWWTAANCTLGTMKLHLDEAFDITFWRNAVRNASMELKKQQKLPEFLK